MTGVKTVSDDPYRRVAGIYDRLFESMNRGLRVLGTRMLPPQPGMSVLDVGCGTGAHLEVYRQAGCDLHGIDTSPAMLDIARNRLGDAADLHLGDATDMPFADDSVDLAFSMFVLHEMDHDIRLATLGEMKRVIKPDGHILLIDFHAGRARPLKGWIVKPMIFLTELTAGGRHFRNYRHFISIRGLPTLIAASELDQQKMKIVAGSCLALHLVQAR
jgi:ubiquinone/menaquinone biosynthesis C-methylase UbiE